MNLHMNLSQVPPPAPQASLGQLVGALLLVLAVAGAFAVVIHLAARMSAAFEQATDRKTQGGQS